MLFFPPLLSPLVINSREHISVPSSLSHLQMHVFFLKPAVANCISAASTAAHEKETCNLLQQTILLLLYILLILSFQRTDFSWLIGSSEVENNLAWKKAFKTSSICSIQILIKEQTENILFICRAMISPSAKETVSQTHTLCVSLL